MPAAMPAVSNQATNALREVSINVERVIRGKSQAIRYALAALLAKGHLLIEDIPGVGKTTLSRALAASLGGSFRRIQFTSDLLPSDILGGAVLAPDRASFEFRRGPIFANIVLADEINRTTPRTQSALLEVMSESRVSVDDTTHELAQPFLVLATQNPAEHFGTYPLPESQMDRFLLRISLGYPSPEVERQLLRERTGEDPVSSLQPVIDHQTILSLQKSVEEVRVEDSLVDYAMHVITETRNSTALSVGISTRGALAWYRAAQALAVVDGRNYCIPDDFKELALPALTHRVLLATTAENLDQSRRQAEAAIHEILDQVPFPT